MLAISGYLITIHANNHTIELHSESRIPSSIFNLDEAFNAGNPKGNI